MPELRMRRLTIEAFRGFNERRDLNVDGSAVLLRGPNGTGKTSFFDAIQWLFVGRIRRLAALREIQRDEYVVNRYRIPGPAFVELECSLDGVSHIIRRVGTSKSSTLSWTSPDGVLEGEAAEEALATALFPVREAELETLLLSTGLLQQDVMRLLLDAKPSERFAELSQLLRLGELERFQKAVNAAHAEARDQAARARAALDNATSGAGRLSEAAQTLKSDIDEQPAVEHARQELRATVARFPWLNLRHLPEAAGDAALLGRESDLAQRELEDIRFTWTELLAEPVVEYSVENETAIAARVARAREASEAARQKLQKAQERLAAAERDAEEFAQLAALALPRLGGTCPVCNLEIDADHVASELHQRSAAAQALADLRSSVQAAAAQAEERAAAGSVAERDLDDIRQRRLETERRREAAARIQSRLRELAEGSILLLEPSATTDPDALRERELALGHLKANASRLSAALTASSSGARLSEVEIELVKSRETEDLRREAAQRAGQAEIRLESLLRATKEARVDVVNERFAQLRPILRDLFARLEAHRAFTELDLEPRLYGQPGTSVMATVRDPDEDTGGTAGLIFSTSQANVAALCYFLALSWSGEGSELPFLMLDDPIQAMDDINVLAFADLCRFLRGRRQLFVSTHERRFADLLARKLSPRVAGDMTRTIEFTGWSKAGPRFSEDLDTPDVGTGDGVRYLASA